MALETIAAPRGVLARMGSLLDLRLGSERDVVRVVMAGISSRSYRRVAARLRLPGDLVAPESTVRRRLASGSRFTEAESERVVRLTRVFAEAVELFGEESSALEWFTTPAEYMPDEPPIAPMVLAATDAGARLIESHIRRTACGQL